MKERKKLIAAVREQVGFLEAQQLILLLEFIKQLCEQRPCLAGEERGV